MVSLLFIVATNKHNNMLWNNTQQGR
jgi:hypothetical protein